MKRFWNAFWPMLAVGAASYFLLDIILGDILLTVAFAIAGQQYAGLVWVPMMTVFYIAVMLVAWYVRQIHDGEAKRAYLAEIGGAVYDRRMDGRAISRNGDYRAELVAYAVIATIQISLTFSILYWPICFPIMYGVFHVCNRRLWLHLRKAWAEGRMHQNPDH